MILLQTVPYLRRRDHFTQADKFGAWVAHQDFARAALQYGSAEGVHFFLPPGGNYSREELSDGIAELRADFPNHEIEIKRLSELGELARANRYVLADNFEAFSQLAFARSTGEGNLFPVSTIVHTIPDQSAFMGYSNVFVVAEPCDTIVTTSEAGKRAISAILEDVGAFLMSRLQIAAVPEVRIVKIPLAVDEEFLQPGDSRAARVALNLPSDATIILYLGRLSETFKGDLEPLLNAFRRLADDRANAYLVIAGQDSENSYSRVLSSMAQQFGIADRVRLMTNFPFCDKPLLLSSCDIFTSPVDNIQETFGLSILEAMAMGLPVIASDWSGYRDLVVPGESGFLARTVWNSKACRTAELVSPFSVRTRYFLAQQTVVDGEDLYRSLNVLIANKELRRQFGENGRRRVLSTFCWPVVMAQYEELWREQWSVLQHSSKIKEWCSPVNYNKQFGHFATMFMQEDTLLRSSPHRSLVRGLDANKTRIPNFAGIQELERVVFECRGRARSIGELLASGTDATLTAVAWLWKKGYLEAVR
jgi:glycosyltransferase involved in cell wall biosynthesis